MTKFQLLSVLSLSFVWLLKTYIILANFFPSHKSFQLPQLHHQSSSKTHINKFELFIQK